MKRGLIAFRMAVEALWGVLISITLIAGVVSYPKRSFSPPIKWGDVLFMTFLIAFAASLIWDAVRMRRKLRAMDALIETPEES